MFISQSDSSIRRPRSIHVYTHTHTGLFLAKYALYKNQVTLWVKYRCLKLLRGNQKSRHRESWVFRGAQASCAGSVGLLYIWRLRSAADLDRCVFKDTSKSLWEHKDKRLEELRPRNAKLFSDRWLSPRWPRLKCTEEHNPITGERAGNTDHARTRTHTHTHTALYSYLYEDIHWDNAISSSVP